MNIKTDGVVIREQFTGEADRIVTLLTREYGVIRAFAHGVRSIKSKNLAATQLLCFSELNIYKSNKNVYTVTEAAAKEVFFGLRDDVVSLSLAQYFAELEYELAPREENADEYLRLLLNLFYLLINKKRPPLQLKATAELRLLSLSGYMPDLLGCCECGTYESEKMFFSTSSGKLYCGDCRPAEKLEAASAGVIAAMRHICLSQPDRIFGFSLSADALERLAEISESYLLKTTMRKYNTLDFFKTMTM